MATGAKPSHPNLHRSDRGSGDDRVASRSAWGGLVALSIALVLGLELANFAIEYLIDHLHPEVAPEIKLVKDVMVRCWSYVWVHSVSAF